VLATLVRAWDVNEYITQRHDKFQQIKAASGQRLALDWIWFRLPFHPDCEYGEITMTLISISALLSAGPVLLSQDEDLTRFQFHTCDH